MVQKFTIVTASDDKYFHFVQGLILSIRDREEGNDVSLSFLDLGCNSDQLRWLEKTVTHIVRADWKIRFPGQESKPDHFKAIVSKPFLRDYFPGYKVYLWMDADTWIQEWDSVALYVRAAGQSKIAVTPEIYRSFKGLYINAREYREFSQLLYEACFGKEQAEKYFLYPMINSGVFAMHADSELWDCWAQKLTIALQRTSHFCVEQTALNYAIYESEFGNFLENVELLPATYNWTCHHSLPLLDRENNKLVEPFLPYEKLKIIHRSGDSLKGKRSVDLLTTEGKKIKMNLKYKEGRYDADFKTEEPEFTPWQRDASKA